MYLGNFHFEKTGDKVRIVPRKHNCRTLCGLLHICKVRFYNIAAFKCFAGQGFPLGQYRFGFAQGDEVEALFFSYDRAADDLPDFVLVFLEDDVPLRFSHLLEKYLFGSLCCYPPEVLKKHWQFHCIADSFAGINRLGIVDGYLFIRGCHRIDHGFHLEDGNVAGLGVYPKINIGFVHKSLFCRRQQGGFKELD